MLVSRRGTSIFPQSWRRKSPGNVRSSRPAGAGPVLDVVRKHLDDAKRGNPRIDRGFRGTHREDRANGPRGQRPVRGIRQESAMDVRAAPCWNWPTDAALVRRTRAVHEHAAIAGSCWRCGNDGLLLCEASEYKRQATS